MLAALARDYLGVPGSSGLPERTFSGAADVCAAGRGSLVPTSIEELVGSLMWRRAKVPLQGDDFAKVNEILRAAGL